LTVLFWCFVGPTFLRYPTAIQRELAAHLGVVDGRLHSTLACMAADCLVENHAYVKVRALTGAHLDPRNPEAAIYRVILVRSLRVQDRLLGMGPYTGHIEPM